MSFLESPRFPDDIAYGSVGGPVFNTTISALESGQERRSGMWSLPIHEWDIGYGVKESEHVFALRDFFMAVRGRLYGFRFKDHWDYTTLPNNATPTPEDCIFGAGDDTTTQFQLVKTYISGALGLSRVILKPVSPTVRVAIDTVEQTEGVDFTVDYTTGIVTFTTPPANAEVLTWGGEFDVPCRFNSDTMEISLETFSASQTSVIIRELRQGSI